MSEENGKITAIREYLLGKNLSEEEKVSIEENLMTSEEYFQKVVNAEEDLIEEYLDKRLSTIENEEFEKNFLTTVERREKVEFEKLLRSHISENNNFKAEQSNAERLPQKTQKPFWQSWFVLPIPIAAGILMIWGITVFFSNSANNDVIASLNKAYAQERPFESRITSFEYAPANNLRGKTEEKVNNTSRRLAENLSLESVEKSQTPQNFHNLGRVYLAGKQFDEAISELNRAKNLDSKNAKILSDLGTALFEKSRSISQARDGKSFELDGQALEEFEKALQIDPNLLEARFNKALCLQARQMRYEAQNAWQDYLKLDSDSKWADEARRNLELLNPPKSDTGQEENAVANFLTAYKNGDEERAKSLLNQNREMISGKLLPQQLAFLFLEKEVERAEYLSALEYAGKLEKKYFNDKLFLDIANFYASLSLEKIISLGEAQSAVKKGYEFSKNNFYQEALNEFVRAREIFAENGDVWEEKIADYWIAYSLFQLSRSEESQKKFEELAAFCEAKDYRWLASGAFSRLGVSTLISNKYSKSLEYNKKALSLAKETADIYQEQKSYGQLADVYRHLKQYAEAFKNAEAAFLKINNPETSIRQKSRTYMYATHILYERKLYAMAVALLKETLKLSEETHDRSYINYSYLLLSKVYDQTGEKAKAFEAARKSLEVAETFPDSDSRNRTIAGSLTQIANVKSSDGKFDEAVQEYDRSVALYETMNFPVNYYEAKKNRLSSYFKIKDGETVEKEITSVLEIFEANRKKILEEQNRNSFFDNEQDIYDLVVGYEFSRKSYEKAFDYAEKSRSRSLLDIQENGARLISDEATPQIVFDEKAGVKPLPLSEIRSQLPPQVQLIEYSVLKDEVLMWLVSRDSFKTFSYKISDTELDEIVERFLQAIKRKSGEEKALGRELYQILFQPLADNLDAGRNVFIIPDKSLFRLPFNALWSTKTENFLIADYKILLSPSANVFLNSSKNAEKLSFEKNENILSIGNPKFDQTSWPNLPNLSTAEQEAREIAGLYPASDVLIGEQATKERFKGDLGKANVIHFAGHYVTNEISPLLSSFLVAGNGEDSRLTNYQLLGQQLSKKKLIVLAACETGAENYFKGEGMVGAGRIFLASGVPLIVASQWKIDSDATTELMKKFHYLRKVQKMDTATALQKAQTEMLNGANDNFRQPFYWAAFSVIGGYADF